MKLLRYIAILMPFAAISQQTLEICGDTKSFTYSTASDIDATIEWYVLGSYYYGDEVTLQWDTPGVFTITATAIATGCPSIPQTMTVTVTECDPLLVWVPNTFTPNGDEFNTTWGATVSGPADLQDFRMRVFNRWGELVFESRDYTDGWDGTYALRPAQDGAYTYQVSFGDKQTDYRQQVFGHFGLIR
jgi:gliding motility-associated-like protein